MNFPEKYFSWINDLRNIVKSMVDKDATDTTYTEELLSELAERLSNLIQFNIYDEFERFILENKEEKKVVGFIKSADQKLRSIKNEWEMKFNEDSFHKAKDEKYLYDSFEAKRLIFWIHGYINGSFLEFNRIKELYTDLKIEPERTFYQRNRNKYVDPKVKKKSYFQKFSFDDWKKHPLEKTSLEWITVEWMIKSGDDLETILKTNQVNIFSIELEFFIRQNDPSLIDQANFAIEYCLRYNTNDYEKLMWKASDLIALEEWHKILNCQREIYDAHLNHKTKYFRDIFKFHSERTIDVSLLVADLINEINEILEGQKNDFSIVPLLHEGTEIRKAFSDIKRGYRHTRNIPFDEYAFREYEEFSNSGIFANCHCVAEALFNFRKWLLDLNIKQFKSITEVDSSTEALISTNLGINKENAKKDLPKLRFESYLSAYSLDKIKPIITRHIKSTPEKLAILTFALGLGGIKPRTRLYTAINNTFQTEFTRQKIEYQFKQCENIRDTGRQKQIAAIKKEVMELSNT